MIAALLIFAVTYALIVSERVDRTAAAVLGACVALITHTVPHEFALERVDLNVIFLLVGMMVTVNLLATTGLFEWIAVTIGQRSGGNPIRIAAGLLIATAVLSAFLDNVTTVVLMAPITILIAQILGMRAEPLLITLAIFSNVGGTATLIGDPPNIVIGARSGLGFNDFLVHLSPFVAVAGIILLLVTLWALRRVLKVEPSAKERIRMARPDLAITAPVHLRRGLAVFALIILGFVVGHPLGIEPGIVALAGALLIVLVCGVSVREAFAEVEWDAIFFLIGLFMLVSALEYHGVFQHLGSALAAATQGQPAAQAIAILWLAGIASAALGALPVTLAMLPLVESLGTGGSAVAEGAVHVDPVLWWALALGACLGGNGTMVGAPANVLVVQIAKRNNYPIAFGEYMTYSVPLTLLSLVLSSLYLYFFYFAGK